jgi:hypothetical protein
MSYPPEPSRAAQEEPNNDLRLCEHCALLGVSSVVRSDMEFTDIIHCTVCHLSFHFITEGNRIIVTQVEPYHGRAVDFPAKLGE